MIAGVANKQIVFIALLLSLMLAAIAVLMVFIVKKYRPINALALAFAMDAQDQCKSGAIDEETLLADALSLLKDDNLLKKKFEAAYHAANAANQAKSAFLSNMSHDIRTPMNAIVGMIDIAEKHLDDRAYVRECLQKARVSSRYLLDIINNVLDMSRIESGKFTLAQGEIDLSKLVHGVLNILNQSMRVKSQNLCLRVETLRDERVLGDGVRLTQIFMNILSNASKFTPNGGFIQLTLRQDPCADAGYAQYAFIFEDNGIGMSPEFVKRVFETFSRDDLAHASRVEGTGLGMSIAKSLVELMGGSIACESELGKGTVFTISLKLKLSKESAADAGNRAPVLVVGAQACLCPDQTAVFRQLGAAADDARDENEALALAERAKRNGAPYGFILINQAEEGQMGVNAALRLNAALGEETTCYVLAVKDPLSVERSAAFNAGVCQIVQLPIFRSDALAILNRAANAQSAVSTKDAVRLDGARILLVEDNAINREIARVLIGETGAQVVEAENGKLAVDAFKAHEPGYFDVILMDVQMPVMNGYEATLAIRSIQREDARTVPIYAMTANTFDDDVRQVMDSGMNGHLGKPYTPEELYRTLLRAMGRE